MRDTINVMNDVNEILCAMEYGSDNTKKSRGMYKDNSALTILMDRCIYVNKQTWVRDAL